MRSDVYLEILPEGSCGERYMHVCVYVQSTLVRQQRCHPTHTPWERRETKRKKGSQRRAIVQGARRKLRAALRGKALVLLYCEK